eukprot:scaffold875_cov185-Amphora_coffeaeformis.AAC.16
MGTCSSKPQPRRVRNRIPQPLRHEIALPRENETGPHKKDYHPTIGTYGKAETEDKEVVTATEAVVVLEPEQLFTEKLRELISGPSEIPTSIWNKIKAETKSNPMDYTKGILGTPFGSTMDEVVALWGTPCGISMWRVGQIELEIYHCRFRFDRNRLTSIMIHEVDLPDVEPIPGIKMGATVPPLMELFPEGDMKTPRASPVSGVTSIRVGNNITIITHVHARRGHTDNLMAFTISKDEHLFW